MSSIPLPYVKAHVGALPVVTLSHPHDDPSRPADGGHNRRGEGDLSVEAADVLTADREDDRPDAVVARTAGVCEAGDISFKVVVQCHNFDPTPGRHAQRNVPAQAADGQAMPVLDPQHVSALPLPLLLADVLKV